MDTDIQYIQSCFVVFLATWPSYSLFNTDPFGYIKLRSHAGRLLGLMYVEVEYRESQKMPDCLESEDSGTFFRFVQFHCQCRKLAWKVNWPFPSRHSQMDPQSTGWKMSRQFGCHFRALRSLMHGILRWSGIRHLFRIQNTPLLNALNWHAQLFSWPGIMRICVWDSRVGGLYWPNVARSIKNTTN